MGEELRAKDEEALVTLKAMEERQSRMTYAVREAIFSKEVLSIGDIMLICGMNYQAAAKLIRDIKRKCDRLGLEGKLHVQDYLDYFGLDGNSNRYAKRRDECVDGVG